MSTPLFSPVIRTAGQDRHTEAEQAPFMNDLLGGRFGVDAFTRYTEQLRFVYRASEDSATRLEGDPVAGTFLRPPLHPLAGTICRAVR